MIVLKWSMRAEYPHDQLRITYSLNMSDSGGSRISCSNERLKLYHHICSFPGIRVKSPGWALMNRNGEVCEEAPLAVVDLSGAPSHP